MAHEDQLALENETLRLLFSRTNGPLVGLVAGPSDWPVLGRAHLGLSFRLRMPLRHEDPVDIAFARPMGRPRAGRRACRVHGEQQTLSRLEVAADARSALFEGDDLSAIGSGAPLPMKVTLKVSLGARQAIWRMTVENRSDHVIESVTCPSWETCDTAGTEPFSSFLLSCCRAGEHPLWPAFTNDRGYWGVDHPTATGPVRQSTPTTGF
jgi:hypothetical protein